MFSSALFSKRNLFLLAIIAISLIFTSPKWSTFIALWVHFAFLLRYTRDHNWKGWLLLFPILYIGNVIGQAEVIPMPLSMVAIFMLVGSLISLIPLLADRLLHHRLPNWAKTLLFPTALTLFQYVMDQGPQGTWGNPVYTQYSFLPLMQTASIFGLYGINFLVAWTASFANQWYEDRQTNRAFAAVNWLMPISLAVVLLFGSYRLLQNDDSDDVVSMATVATNSFDVVGSMYEAAFDSAIELSVEMSQSDPAFVEVQKGIAAFMAAPDSSLFTEVLETMDAQLDKYAAATREAATQGAKIVTWSEAAIFNIKSREQQYEQLAASLANELDIYLFFPTAVFHPEKFGIAPHFIENKVLAFSPEGELLNTYFKNIPIAGVEPSFPGDGNIPVIETPYGNLSPLICYDADHPNLVAQVSQQATDMLVVPTGDWKAISPYHTQMAVVRCIENGVSMLKATNGGLSAMIDDKGRMQASYDFYDEADMKVLVHELPIQSSDTAYATFAPLFIQVLFGFFLLCSFYAILSFFLKRKQRPALEVANV